MNKGIQRLLAVLTAAATFFLILTISIGLPIYIRSFYYAHIGPMELARHSGFSEAEIRQAYDEVLDYLTIPGREFGTGVMAHSESGADHFADCRVLFFLNGGVLVCAAGVLFLLHLATRGRSCTLLGRSGGFWGAWAAVVLPVVIGGLAALDFDRAFVIFHSIFFPGKDNWIFNSTTDQIILVLPQDFFMHCAMLIGGGVVLLSGMVIVWEFAKGKRGSEVH